MEDVKVKIVRTPYGEPNLWALSTLPESHNRKNLVRVYKIKGGGRNPPCRERIWLHDILDENDIPYAIEITGEYPLWCGKRGRKFKETQHIFVEKKNKEAVIKIIEEYENPEIVMPFEGREVFDINDMPQVKCQSCGKECDSDFCNCPFCKSKLY